MTHRSTSRSPAGLLPRNPLFRLLVVNWLVGFAVALVVLGGLFATNTGSLRDLVANAQDPVVPIVMLGFGLIITLCSAAMGTAIMMLPSVEGGRGGGHRRRPQPVQEGLTPVRVVASARR
ncbi:hypothetical protein [Polymorphum gilvum]|uniref:Uncharacterized protein n=1 Tax=Polymorphum gilvum (strain LMG 25793 / CGMCC 1.9160 / SL003B-26A1) TaxID=991905 RepID=F2J589_POLGS|nr:hypothetical protein [Polymorphum gilvum]ADZ71148.1 hypothetical protein SL003B_2725 [Polymorphum gilvum SL003B-26A1]